MSQHKLKNNLSITDLKKRLNYAEVKLDKAKAHGTPKEVLDVLISNVQELRTARDRLLHKLSKNHRVTDHAVLAYIERVLDIDVNSMRNRILGEDLEQIKVMNDGRIERENFTLVVANHKVITVIKD